MSSSKIKIQSVLDKVFRFGQERTELYLTRSYLLLSEDQDPKAKKEYVPFSRSSGLIYSPEYRLAAATEELIVEKLHSLHLPAPGYYLDDSTPEDNPRLVEELKNAPTAPTSVEPLEDLDTLQEDGDVSFSIQSTGGVLGKKIKYTKVSQLYTADNILLPALNLSLGITKSTRARPAAKKTPVRAKVKKKEEPVDEEVCEVEEEVSESIEEPVVEAPVRAARRRPVRRITQEVSEPEPEPEPEPKRPVRPMRRSIRTPRNL